MSRHTKIEEPQNFELSDEMRAFFIKRGLNTTDQFLINMMMRGEDGYQKLLTSEVVLKWREKVKKKNEIPILHSHS